jgi:hypothetical protein
MRRVKRGWVFAAAACVLTCGGAPFPRETTASNTRTDDVWLDGPRCAADFHADTTLKIERLEPGIGKMVGDGETVRVHYIAQLPSGVTLHDTRDGGAPIQMVIGSTKIICGFERALLGMHAGERRRVAVPWRLAFGDAGRPPDVEPRADLVFLIDLFLPADPEGDHGTGPVRPPAARGGGRGPGGH